MTIEGLDYRQYASTLKHLVPELRTIAVLDSDGKKVKDEVLNADFKIVRWKRYEQEISSRQIGWRRSSKNLYASKREISLR